MDAGFVTSLTTASFTLAVISVSVQQLSRNCL